MTALASSRIAHPLRFPSRPFQPSASFWPSRFDGSPRLLHPWRPLDEIGEGEEGVYPLLCTRVVL